MNEDAKPKRTRQLRLPKRIFRNQPAFLKDVEFRPVEKVAELENAGHLVYREYLASGYISPKPSELHFSIYQTISSTVTFAAIYKKSQVLGTLTVIEDSPLGVPMDKIYHDELNALRARGVRFAEVSMLALDEERLKQSEFAMNRAQRLLFVLNVDDMAINCLRSTERLDELVACFHPTHQFIYDWMSFTPLGQLKTYDDVRGKPAVALHLNKQDQLIKSLSDSRHQDLGFFCERPTKDIRPLRFTASDLRSLFVEQTDALAAANAEQLAAIKACYPTYDFDEILRRPTSPSLSPLTDALLRAACKKPRGSDVLDADSEKVEETAKALRGIGFRRGERIAVLCSDSHEEEWSLIKKAAVHLGGNAVGLTSAMTPEETEKIFNHYSPDAVVVANREQMANVPDGYLDSLKFIVLIEDIRKKSDRVMLFEVLFSPPISVPVKFHFWRDLYRMREGSMRTEETPNPNDFLVRNNWPV